MRLFLLKSLTVVMLVLALPAWAVEPTPGLYNSPSLGGTVQEGRATNSWSMVGNGAMGVGDVWNAMSWNGVALGVEWKFECVVSPIAQAVQDNRDGNGTGTVVLTTNYSGGTFFLSKNGPWGDGTQDFTGMVAGTQIITTLQYVQFVLITARENINSSGFFAPPSSCALTFLLTNGVRLGDTDSGAVPANYPALLDPNCQPTRIYGSWSDIVDVTLQIDCALPVEASTWGGVKALYGN